MELKMAEQVKLDREWLELIAQAKQTGLNVTEVREFLQTNVKQKETV
ncbi:DNA-binding anti-repressor SinI [Bacillus sp. V59.32b]|nr:DNA-binding anti-repressor SinI [Bacillus sp. V59.32b]